MADTRAATGLTVQQWDDDFFTNYFQENLFAPYMGTNENSVIQVNEDLTKKQGDSFTFALVNRLTNAVTTGSNWMEGNEEDLISRSWRLTVNKIRHAVRIPEMEEQRSAIDLREGARAMLKVYFTELLRDNLITALGSINGTAYNGADATARNAWVVDNADRVLFGSAISNYNATHATALLNVDTSADRLTPTVLSLMKRIALTASPKISPIVVEGGYRRYVVFCGPRTFRDLAQNATITQANREAMERGRSNPVFRGADLEWDGLIIKQIDDIPVYAGVGASTSDVSPVYLCGAQALGAAYARRSRSVTKKLDYDDKYGVEMSEIRGIGKMIFGTGSGDTDDTKDHGVVTGYMSAPADA